MDITRKIDRAELIREMRADENRRRKEEQFKRREIYNGRSAYYVEEDLKEEFNYETVKEMRKIYSINICKKVVDELASIYRTEPERIFTEVSEGQHEEIIRAYDKFEVDQMMKRANKMFKLHDQCTIKVIPKHGKLVPMALSPHQYDVIPMDDDPTKAYGYVINTLDRSLFLDDVGEPSRYQNIGNTLNEKIADVDDYRSHMNKYVWWTKEWNMVTDQQGDLLEEPVVNPINELPFIDISSDREFEYWSRAGSDIADFQLEFLKILSDHFNVLKLQGYSQAVIVSEEVPEQFRVGPNTILHLRQRADGTQSPSFEFVTPSPDMSASLESIELFIRAFLSTRGLNAGTIASRQSGESFSSGLERLLAMLEKFEATSDDLAQFHTVEDKYYHLFKKWQEASASNDLLADDCKIRGLSPESKVEVMYHKPEMIQTQKEIQDSAIALMEAGLMSRKQAIAKIHGITEEAAEEVLADIDADDMGGTPVVNEPQVNQVQGELRDQSEEITG